MRAKRRKGSLRGAAARAHDLREARCLAQKGLEVLGLPPGTSELKGWGRWLEEKSLLAALIRGRTGAGNAWVAERLAMGHEGNVTRAVRRVRGSKALGKRLRELEKLLGIRD